MSEKENNVVDDNKKSLNFIEALVEKDLAAGRRVPPG